jgi:hypothetical protein
MCVFSMRVPREPLMSKARVARVALATGGITMLMSRITIPCAGVITVLQPRPEH